MDGGRAEGRQVLIPRGSQGARNIVSSAAVVALVVLERLGSRDSQCRNPADRAESASGDLWV